MFNSHTSTCIGMLDVWQNLQVQQWLEIARTSVRAAVQLEPECGCKRAGLPS